MVPLLLSPLAFLPEHKGDLGRGKGGGGGDEEGTDGGGREGGREELRVCDGIAADVFWCFLVVGGTTSSIH